MKKKTLAFAAALTFVIIILSACTTVSRTDERACDNFTSLVAPFELHTGELSGNPEVRKLNCTGKTFGINKNNGALWVGKDRIRILVTHYRLPDAKKPAARDMEEEARTYLAAYLTGVKMNHFTSFPREGIVEYPEIHGMWIKEFHLLIKSVKKGIASLKSTDVSGGGTSFLFEFHDQDLWDMVFFYYTYDDINRGTFNTSVARKRLRMGDNVNGMDIWNIRFRTRAVHRAASKGNVEALKFLVQYGARLNVKTARGNTVLHMAAIDSNSSDGNIPAIRFILEHGAGINETDGNGTTALHFAALWGSEKAVRYLIERGADTEIRDASGKRPVDNANGPAKKFLEDHEKANF